MSVYVTPQDVYMYICDVYKPTLTFMTTQSIL
jgi:hypothetical protein